MEKIGAQFKVHNVGQGFFYSGTISSFEREFHFVYDCGSENTKYVEAAVENYLDEFSPKQIDMLVISHFDLDHVSGIHKLISDERIVAVDKIFIPYYTKTKEQKKFSLLLLDMLMAIHFTDYTQKIKKIILVPDYSEEKKVISFNERTKQEISYVDNGEIKNIDNEIKKNISQDTLIKCTELPEKTDLIYNAEWVFDFFNLGIDDSVISVFNSEIEEYLKQEKVDNLIDLFASGNNKKHTKAIKDLYTSVFSGKGLPGNDCCNNTSLCLFHGPISENYPLYKDKYIDPSSYFNNHMCVRTSYITEEDGQTKTIPSYYNWAARGNLLTGDIDLKNNGHMVQFDNHFAIRKGDIKYLFLPHHGSKNNWNDELLEYSSGTGIHCVTSAGKFSKYKHPNVEVVSKFYNKLISVNETKSLTYCYGNWRDTVNLID
ncbi:MAG: MBL fold metallo-hydrolase [Bacilli bacterium]|nr:MBL fold metallo-hydrolase [Bacilli bacterium]